MVLGDPMVSLYSEWTHHHQQLQPQLESTLNRVCATHAVRSYFPNLLHRRQIRHPVDRTVPDNFDFRLAVFYGRTVHAILAVSYSLQNGSMPSRPAHVHDSPG